MEQVLQAASCNRGEKGACHNGDYYEFGGQHRPRRRESAAGTMAARTTPTGAIEASDEETIVIESPLYRVEMSNRGATVHSWKLKKYLNDRSRPRRSNSSTQPRRSNSSEWPLSLSLDDPQLESKANTGLYQVSSQGTSFQAPVEMTFHWSDGHIDVVKKLKFGEQLPRSSWKPRQV